MQTSWLRDTKYSVYVSYQLAKSQFRRESCTRNRYVRPYMNVTGSDIAELIVWRAVNVLVPSPMVGHELGEKCSAKAVLVYKFNNTRNRCHCAKNIVDRESRPAYMIDGHRGIGR